MIKIIRIIFFSIAWYFVYDKVKKADFTEIYDNLNVQIRALSVVDTIKFLIDIAKNNLIQNALLNSITLPFNLSLSTLIDTRPKKWSLFVFVFSIIIHRWLFFFKKVVLWPFKLGVFSFIYSLIGIDLSWLLNVFNVFTVNIPYWVYFQYLTLYNNWINWWYNTVNIKTINSVPLIGNKKIQDEGHNTIIENKSSSNKKFWYTLGLVTLLGLLFSIWYFDVWDYFTGSSKGSGGSSSSINPDTAPNLENPHQIHIDMAKAPKTPKGRDVSDAVNAMNQRMDEFNNPSSGSNPKTGLSRYFLNRTTSQLNKNPWWKKPDPLGNTLFKNRPDSPDPDSDSNSDDSGQTVTPSNLWD